MSGDKSFLKRSSTIVIDEPVKRSKRSTVFDDLVNTQAQFLSVVEELMFKTPKPKMVNLLKVKDVSTILKAQADQFALEKAQDECIAFGGFPSVYARKRLHFLPDPTMQNSVGFKRPYEGGARSFCDNRMNYDFDYNGYHIRMESKKVVFEIYCYDISHKSEFIRAVWRHQVYNRMETVQKAALYHLPSSLAHLVAEFSAITEFKDNLNALWCRCENALPPDLSHVVRYNLFAKKTILALKLNGRGLYIHDYSMIKLMHGRNPDWSS